MKHKKTARFVITALLLAIASTICVTATFKDIGSSPYQDAIEEIADLKITVGNGNNEFMPNDNVNRQQMTLFLARLLTGNEINGFEQTSNDTPFTDITDSTYFKSTLYCYENGIIMGRSGTTFDPTGTVTFQEAVTMAVRALGYSDLAFPEGYMQTAKDFGMLTKLENTKYTAPMTRGQIAQLIYNTLHNNNFVGGKGKSLYDTHFSETQTLGYFEIKSYDELRANYTCKPAQYNLCDGYNSYIVEDVTFMGYTGDLQYYFANNIGTASRKCFIDFRFAIMGEYKVVSPVAPLQVVNPCNKLTAAEAKALIEPINTRLARYAMRPVVEYNHSTLKAGGPSDIYKATVDGYTDLSVYYQEKDGDKFLPRKWALQIHAETSSSGGLLKGVIEYIIR